MLTNYFKIAWRSLQKNKFFSFLNIAGLGIAFPFALLALLQLRAAFEFDNFHPHSDRVFRILTDEKANGGGTDKYASSPFLLAETLAKDYACVEKATRVVRVFGWEMNNRIKNLAVNTIYVEPTFFEMFGFSLANGAVPSAPNELIISHEAAQRFFGEADPIGQSLMHPTYGAFKITGVLRPYKRETQFRSDVMISMASYLKTQPEMAKPAAWGAYESHTFVRVLPQTPPQALDAALADVAEKSKEHLAAANKTHTFRAQAIADISPSAEDLRFNPYVDSRSDIYFNFSFPLMMLFLAGFNYVNLTLARSLSRTREVGIRKVVGALRWQLMYQFVCEAVLIAFFALFTGLLLLAVMKQFIHVQWVTWEVENKTAIGLAFAAFTLVLGILAGVFPAWVLSGFQPAKVLKGMITPASFGKVNLRKTLIVIQFVVTIAFVFMIGHMYNQFHYMATENTNFNRKGIFNLSLFEPKDAPLLADEIAKNTQVQRVGFASIAFGGPGAVCDIKPVPGGENMSSYYYAADRNFIENMKLHILAGENLPLANRDSAGNFALLNEKAIEKLGFGSPQEAIGKAFWINDKTALTVAGVVRDFCHYNYQFQKEALVFHHNPAQFQMLSIQTLENTPKEAFLAQMQAIWKQKHPFQEMGYAWHEQELYERYYPAEDMKMMGLASVVVLIIALMGLLGMVTYSTEKRVKEVGIRKVMGASVAEVVRLLSWGFLKLLLLSALIALPIGYLTGVFFNSVFTYHNGINLGLMGFFLAVILGIAVFTVGFYAIRAALANPAHSLKSE